MPELPEVETLRLSLQPHLIGRRFSNLTIRDTRLRFPVDAAALQAALPGQRISELRRRGKYLIVTLESGKSLIVHLGMSGRLLLTAADSMPALHEHVTFQLDDGRQLRFRDPRRFGLVEIADNADYPRFRGMGIEPLSKECTPTYLMNLAKGVKKPIKNFIMDGTQLVGVGNIYAAESLFVAAIHPQKSAGKLSLKQWQALTKAIKSVLRAAIRQGGTTLNDFQDGNGQSGYFQVRLRVYDRQGDKCVRCGTSIQCKVMAGRSTYFCPGCQKRS